MYKHWYVAQINQLTNMESGVFLASLEALENEMFPAQLRKCALTELSRQFDLNLQIYALPSALHAAVGEDADSVLSIQSAEFVREVCAKTENAEAIRMAQSLRNREELIRRLENYKPGETENGQGQESDYLELISRVDLIMALGIFKHLSTEEVSNMLEGDDSWTGLFRKAAAGVYGRCIQALACEAVGHHRLTFLQSLSAGLMQFSPGYYAQPDLLSAWLNLRSVSLSAKDILRIRPPFEFKRAVESKRVCNAMAWLFQGRRDGEIGNEEYACSAENLWNFSLWMLALKCSVREGTFSELSGNLSDEWEKLRSKKSKKTPWIYRRSAKYDKQEKTDKSRYPEYPEMQTQSGALKAALAVPVLSFMISHFREEVPGFVVDLSLDLYDALAGAGVRAFIENGLFGTRDYSGSVTALLTYGRNSTEQIGKGYSNPLIPELYTRSVEKKACSVFNNAALMVDEQEQFLHSGASVMACSFLAYEEATGTLPIGGKKRFWMEGGKDSFAARICSVSLNEFCSFINTDPVYNGSAAYQVLIKSISLAYEHFPELITEEVKSNLKVRDWLSESKYLDDEKYALYLPELLLGDYSADEWQSASTKIPGRDSNRYRMRFMALTLKLAAVLKGKNELSEAYYPDVRIWAENVAGFYKKEEFSRIHRYITKEYLEVLLSPGAFGKLNRLLQDAQSDLLNEIDIAEMTVVAIADLSRDAIFYQYALGDAILSSQMEETESLKDIRCIYFLLLLEQLMLASEEENSPVFPCSLMEKRETAKTREYLLLWFVDGLRPQIRRDIQFRNRLADIVRRLQNTDASILTVSIGPDEIVDDGNKQLLDKYSWTEENNYWDPDTLGCVARNGNNVIVNRVPAVSRDGIWLPLERDYLTFLLEKADCSEPVKMVVIEYDENSVLVSTEPGINYRLAAKHWEDYGKIAETVGSVLDKYEAGTPYGLYVYATITENGGIPMLQFNRSDAANFGYCEMFQPDVSYSRQELQNYPEASDALNRNAQTEYFCLKKNGWDMVCRRKGKAGFDSDEAWKMLNCRQAGQEEAIIRRLIRYSCGQVVTLNITSRINENRIPSSVLGFTEDGVMVQVDSDSVAMDHYTLRHTTRIKAVFTSVPGQDFNKPKPNGVIWAVNNISKRAQIKYLDEAGSVSDKEVSFSELNVSGIYCGIPVSVQQDRAEITLYLPDNKPTRMIRARRLWEIDRVQGNAATGNMQQYVGKYEFIRNMPAVYLVQDFSSGKLIAYQSDMADPPQNICGIEIGTARVSATRFAGTDDMAIVKCVRGSKTFYGEAKQGIFSMSRVHCSSITVRLKEIYDKEEGKRYYDLHRIFAEPIAGPQYLRNSETVIYPQSINQNTRIIKQFFEDFQSWSTDEGWDMQAEGRITESNGCYYFQPEKPLSHLPVDFGDPSRDELKGWVDKIPVGTHEFEPSKRFINRRAFAVIRWDGGLCAYPDETQVFDLNRFQEWIDRANGYEKCPLYFVKSDGDTLIFEWGIGFRLVLREKEFRIGGRQDTGNILFFGDRIKRYSLIHNRNGNYLRVDSIKDIEISFEHRMVDFRRKENGKPFVRVTYDKERDQISTGSVTIRTRQSELGGNENGWSFEQPRRGLLDEETVNRIKARLPEGGSGYILAKAEWDGNRLRMRYSLSDVEVGDILCLMGGEICQFSNGNDYYVPFTSPFASDMYLNNNGFNFEVHVTRRRFSYCESTLRTHFIVGNRSVFRNAMLVRVTGNAEEENKETAVFTGDIKTLDERTTESVREWLGTEKDPQYVVIGDMEKRDPESVRVELRPGVFCKALKGKGCFHSGATGKLFLKNRNVYVDVISESDDIFCQKGRTVELLLIGAARLQNQEGPHFTVAGLPQIHLRNQQLGRGLIWHEPPRYGVLKGAGESEVDSIKNVPLFGYLKVEEVNGRSRIAWYKKNSAEPERYTMFHKMSFLDGSVNDLQNHIMRGRWHYHDQTTKQKTKNGDYKTIVYGQNSNLPVLFSDGWSLRYRTSDLFSFAFPPHEIEEFGIPEDQKTLDGYYPVAGKEKDAVYVELLPGRVVRLPLKLLQIDFSRSAENVLHAEVLAEGDMLRLAAREREAGKPMEIAVTDIRYGIRSYVQKRAFLMLRDQRIGSITLGNKAFSLKYPSVQPAPEKKPEVMCLSAENRLEPLCDGNYPETGDIVTVQCDENGKLQAAGFHGAEVCVSDHGTTAWEEQFWLKEGLNKFPKEVLKTLGGSLLMRVEAADRTAGRIQVSYPQPDRPEIGEILCATVLGSIPERGMLFLRAGIRLFILDIAESLGVSCALAGVILKSEPFTVGKSVWVRYTGTESQTFKEYKIGIKREHSKIFKVRIISSVDDKAGTGYLCENTNSREWYWMPLENVAHAECATAEAVWRILREFYRDSTDRSSMGHPVFSVVYDSASGFVSWIAANGTYQKRFLEMKAGDTEHPVTVKIVAKVNENKPVYLCYERPRGNIYQLRAEKEQELNGAAAFVSAVCSKKEGTYAELIPEKEIRTEIMLSHYFLESLRQGYVFEEHAIKNWNRIQVRYSAYMNTDPEKQLLDLLCQKTAYDAQDMSPGDPDYKSWVDQMGQALCVWKQTIDAAGSVSKKTADVPVWIALALAVYASLQKPDIEKAVLKILQQDADLYCCEEILLKNWLCDTKHHVYDLRHVLERLDLRGIQLTDGKANQDYLGKLTPEQFGDLRLVTETLLRRNRISDSTDIMEIALALRYSVERRPDQELNKAWEQCWCNGFRDADVMSTARLKEICEELCRNTRVLGHICVRKPKEILDIFNKITG